jgi:hypothetical protein
MIHAESTFLVNFAEVRDVMLDAADMIVSSVRESGAAASEK